MATLPGELFGRPSQELSLRICVGDFDGKRALEAAYHAKDIDEEFLKKYCQNYFDGIQLMSSWIKAKSSR